MGNDWAKKEAAIKRIAVNGLVDPRDLVNEARHPQHPCHGDFTWDDAEAADKHRIEQARGLIRRCKFTVEVEDLRPVRVTYYVASPKHPGKFTALPKVKSLDEIDAVFVRELRELRGYAGRVMGIAEAKRGQLNGDILTGLREVCDILDSLAY